MKRIFQIGFNKSGTGSMDQFFELNGIKSIHWDNGNLSKAIHANYKEGKPLLTGYEDYIAFTDMEHMEENYERVYSAELYYRELDKQYPGSLFILNTRELVDWVRSRLNQPTYLEYDMVFTGRSISQVIEHWVNRYDEHAAEVRSYFNGRDAFLDLEVKAGNELELGIFLKKHGFTIVVDELPHMHRTAARMKAIEKRKAVDEHINSLRDAALFFEKEKPALSFELMRCAARLRPKGPLILKKLREYEAKKDPGGKRKRLRFPFMKFK